MEDISKEVTNTQRELPSVPHEKIKVGQTIEIPMGSSVLFGGGGGVVQGEENLEKVYEVVGLENNPGISNFGVCVTYDRESQKVGVSKPHLTVDKRLYVPENRITVTDLSEKPIDIYQEYGLKLGEGIYRIFVGDERDPDDPTKKLNNGFILEVVGTGQLRLNGIINNGAEKMAKLNR